jgi:hypothetical protein
MRSLLLRVVLYAAVLICGFTLGKHQPNEASRKAGLLAGRLSACQELLSIMQKTGTANPEAACVVVNGDAALGFPAHADAPHFHLDGSEL